MTLMVYNTARRRKVVFKPVEEGVVRMYVCGITPYDHSHVGHARSYVAFDFIRRSLEYLGYNVRYVQNFTDVDDKIIERAMKEGVPPLELSRRYSEEYLREMDALNVKRADSYPRVSEKIPQIIEMIQGLIDRGAAYVVDGDVYLDVSCKEDYGRLSGQDIGDLKAGARVEVDERKHHPLDFALWKKAKSGEISWPSPWGRGRPGWHIECSVMSMEELGITLDIHGGGQDLIFPHHENERAQSELYTGKPFCRYWLHNGLVTVDGEKMSKSLGNYITIKELLERYNPQALRFFLLSAHYRRPLDFSERALRDSEKGLMRLQNTFYNVKNALKHLPEEGQTKGFKEEAEIARKQFTAALEDDFNAPEAIAALFDLARLINTYLAEGAGKKDLTYGLKLLREFTGVFGLSFVEELPEIAARLLDALIDVRAGLRAKKDFESADEIRERLLNMGIILEDRNYGTVWRFTEHVESQR